MYPLEINLANTCYYHTKAHQANSIAIICVKLLLENNNRKYQSYCWYHGPLRVNSGKIHATNLKICTNAIVLNFMAALPTVMFRQKTMEKRNMDCHWRREKVLICLCWYNDINQERTVQKSMCMEDRSTG